MAMCRPIIMGVKGPARDIVNDANAGVSMEPESEEDLVKIAKQLADDRAMTSQIGKQARDYVTRHYNRDRKAEEMLEVMRSVVMDRHTRSVSGRA